MTLTVKSSVVTKDNVEGFKKAIRELLKNDVLVGIPDTNAERAPQPGEKDTASNALIGYVMETGSPAKNIPARPFLVPGVESVRDDIAAQMKRGGKAALDNKPGGVEQAQIATGLIAQSAVKAKITSNIPPPLAQRTLDERKQRGVTRSNTLIDTGQLLNAVNFVVRPKGK